MCKCKATMGKLKIKQKEATNLNHFKLSLSFSDMWTTGTVDHRIQILSSETMKTFSTSHKKMTTVKHLEPASKLNLDQCMYCTEGLNPRVYYCRLAHQALFRQGFKLMSSWAGVRHCNQRASYPAEIVRVLAGFSTELPPVPSEFCTASGVDKCVAAMAYLVGAQAADPLPPSAMCSEDR
jgi:hypothetical protein